MPGRGPGRVDARCSWNPPRFSRACGRALFAIVWMRSKLGLNRENRSRRAILARARDRPRSVAMNPAPLPVSIDESGEFAGIVTVTLEQPGRAVVVLDHDLLRRIEAT